MKYSLLFLLFFICSSQTQIQTQTLNEYSRVKIDLRNTHITEMASLGLEADHGIYVKGRPIYWP